MNGQYLMRMTADEIYPHLVPFLGESARDARRAAHIIELNKMRGRTLRGVADQMAIYFVADDAIEYDAEAVKKHIKGDDLAARLSALHDALASTDPFDVATSEAELRSSPKRKASARRTHPPSPSGAHGTWSSHPRFSTWRWCSGKNRTLRRSAEVDREVADVGVTRLRRPRTFRARLA